MFVNRITTDDKTAALFTQEADIQAMLRFELALAEAQAEEGVISTDAFGHLETKIAAFKPDYEALEAAFEIDGLVLPELVRQLRATLSDEFSRALHLGSTSQDVLDSSLMVRLCESEKITISRLGNLLARIAAMTEGREQAGLMAHTRMQAALPITLQQKTNNWIRGLEAAKANAIGSYPVQIGGPVGIWNDLDPRNPAVGKRVAEKLGLCWPGHAWHTDRAIILQIAHWYGQVAAAVAKIARDLLLMAQNEVAEAEALAGGTSSAMAHKKNPVVCEFVLAQAAHVQTLCAGLQHNTVHENERSGEKWTLEWILLPGIVMATGSTLLLGEKMLAGMKINPGQ